MILKNSLIFFGLIHLLMLNNSFAQGSRTKFSNEQIVAMTGSYLKKMPGSPVYLGAKVYVDSKLGKTYQIHLQVNRSRENEGLGFAFDTMLGLQPYFKFLPRLSLLCFIQTVDHHHLLFAKEMLNVQQSILLSNQLIMMNGIISVSTFKNRILFLILKLNFHNFNLK